MWLIVMSHTVAALGGGTLPSDEGGYDIPRVV